MVSATLYFITCYPLNAAGALTYLSAAVSCPWCDLPSSSNHSSWTTSTLEKTSPLHPPPWRETGSFSDAPINSYYGTILTWANNQKN